MSESTQTLAAHAARTHAHAHNATRTRSALLAAAAAVVWIGVLCRTVPAAQPTREALADAPDLPAVSATCSVTGEFAAARARAAETSAFGAVERYPFDPSEGLRALARFAEAADCFRVAGDHTEAARIAVRMQGWRAHLERDYHDHLLRYRLAIAGGRNTRALADLEFLLALLQRDGGHFAARVRKARDALAAHGTRSTDGP